MNDESSAPDVVHRRLLTAVGASLIAGGAPVTDAEDEVRRLGAHLGHPAVQVAGYPTWMSLSLGPGEPAAIQRIDGPLRLDQSVGVGEVRRDLLGGELDVARALGLIARIRRQPARFGLPGMVVGNLVVAMGICLILQPAVANVLVAGLCSVMVSGLVVLVSRHPRLAPLLPSMAALAVTVVVLLATRHGLVTGALRTLICPIAVLLPGALLSTGVTELAAGSVVSGTSRVFQGSVQLLLFALGVVVGAAVLGIPTAALTNSRLAGLGPGAQLVGLLLIGVGITLSEAVPWRVAGWCFAVLVATFAVQSLGQRLDGGLPVGAFLGAVVASFTSSALEALRPNLPRLVVFLPSFWLLVPGTLGLVGITTVGAGTGRADALYGVVLLVTGIALGLLVGSTLASPLHRMRRR